METIEVNGNLVEFDKYGFIKDPDQWSEDVARVVATHEGIHELTEDHWKVIRYLRDNYKKYQISLICANRLRRLCKDTNITPESIHKLFPSGFDKSAHKLAGLPKPTGCV